MNWNRIYVGFVHICCGVWVLVILVVRFLADLKMESSLGCIFVW